MGIASLVIGIIAALLGFIPFCGYFAVIPAVIGLILGIVDVVLKGKKQMPKGMGVAGTVLNGIAILVVVAWTVVFASASSAVDEAAQQQMLMLQQQQQQLGQPGFGQPQPIPQPVGATQ